MQQIEYNKHHHGDLDQCREEYRQKLGIPPTDGTIYNYYVNMLGSVLETHSDKRRSKLSRIIRKTSSIGFPYSIAARQDMIKVLMIIQADVVNSIAGGKAIEGIPSFDTTKRIADLMAEIKELRSHGAEVDRGGLIQQKFWRKEDEGKS